MVTYPPSLSINEIILSVHPIVLGTGIPLFKNLQKQLDLKLVKSIPYQNVLHGRTKDRYQKDENKYQNDGSDSKYVMGSGRGSGNSITVNAANDQNNECKTSGNMSPIGSGACVNTGTATASNNGGLISEGSVK
jgi:hypothetical protein